MPSNRRSEYDEDLLIELIARGEGNYQQIADRVGISRSMVSRIAHGHARKELQDRIAATIECFRTEAHRLGIRWLRPLLAKHIKHGIEGDDEIARKCREYTLNAFLTSSPNLKEQQQGQYPSSASLTAEDYEAITKLKGGPLENAQTPQ